jgi:hypothetical protein
MFFDALQLMKLKNYKPNSLTVDDDAQELQP